MISEDEIKKIKEEVEILLQKMTITGFDVKAELSILKNENELFKGGEDKEVVDLNIKLEEPQFLIGQNGQTLLELQRFLRIILNKKLSQLRRGSSMDSPSGQKNFYLKLDINDYKKKKIEYLKNLARDLANEVSLTKEKKILSPMPAYERRIIHIELAQRRDVITESQGDGANRCVVISPTTQ